MTREQLYQLQALLTEWVVLDTRLQARLELMKRPRIVIPVPPPLPEFGEDLDD